MKNVYLLAVLLFCVQITFAGGINNYKLNAKEPASRQVDDGGTIASLEELLWLSENPDAWDEDWILEANIDASETVNWNGGLGFSPIGDSPTEFGVRQQIPFTGTFDGQGFVISNITINRPSEPYVGFFGQITGGTVVNLVLDNAVVNGYRYVGGFVGYTHQNAELDHCSFNGDVEATEYGGGFVGITYSYVTISNSYSSGNVSVNMWGGGFVADNYTYSVINSCYSLCDVSGNDYIGGFASMNRWFSEIYTSYATGDVSNNGWYSGGFAGINDDGYIENSFASGEVFGQLYAGGFAGHNFLSENANMGFNNCYAIGQVSGGGGYLGGLVGKNEGYVTDCYFDMETTGTTEPCGSGCSPGQVSITGLLSEEFAEASNFINWDFENIWNIYIDNSISPVARPYLGEVIETYALSLVSNPEEAGLLSGSGSFTQGEEVLISAQAIGYYEFDNWTDEEGNILSTDTETSIIMPAEDLMITANFHTTIGIEDLLLNTLNVYPNPAQDNINIEIEEPIIFRIMDVKGKLVLEKDILSNSTIDISQLKAGVYLVSMISLNTNKTIQLIKK